MKKIRNILVQAMLCLGLTGCSDYLDIVPDNIVEITKMFESREKAMNALSTCYSYLPKDEMAHISPALMGSEYMCPVAPGFDKDSYLKGIRIMRGFQSPTAPILTLWDGANGARPVYQGIRFCNIFLENVDLVPDFEGNEKADFVAQVKFLKAYYHFLLIRDYGPIVIADKNFELNETTENIRQYRRPVEECFKYVVDLIDEAIPNLTPRKSKTLAGQIDRCIAMAIKGKVLLYAASPLFNGNSEFYSNFKDPKTGKTLFPMEYDANKWKIAANALKQAIDYAESNNFALYEYSGAPKEYDKDEYDMSGVMKYAYTARYKIVESFNDELIWGNSGVNFSGSGTMQHAAQMRSEENPSMSSLSFQWMGASFQMLDLFYSKNGVPIDEDKSYDYENRFKVAVIPNDNYHLGYLQQNRDPQERTVQVHFNREPRFYAWLATDRGIWRTYNLKNNMRMRYNEIPGAKTASKGDDCYITGIGIKKLVHPESGNQYWQRVIKYPWPILRVADLYLMYAEALNEAEGPDNSDVCTYVNRVREKVGLPKIEDVWSNDQIVKHVNKHKTTEGMRSIIHQERLIELCFEGHQYYDVRRWKRATEFFNENMVGWDVTQSDINNFYNIIPLQTREWNTPKDYFFPITNSELNTNPNLIQNVGW